MLLRGVPARPYIVWGTGLQVSKPDTSLGVLPEHYSGSFLLFQLVLLEFEYITMG